jgi:site-specific recombinase XerC
LLFHALRREGLCKLKVKDFQHALRGVPHFQVEGKGEKTRYLPLHPGTNALIHEYLEATGHGDDEDGALFRPIKNNRTKTLENSLDPAARGRRRHSDEARQSRFRHWASCRSDAAPAASPCFSTLAEPYSLFG